MVAGRIYLVYTQTQKPAIVMATGDPSGAERHQRGVGTQTKEQDVMKQGRSAEEAELTGAVLGSGRVPGKTNRTEAYHLPQLSPYAEESEAEGSACRGPTVDK